MALSAAVIVTACGGGGDTPSASQTGNPPPVTPPATPPPVNAAPTIGGQPATGVRVGEAYSFKPTAADSDGDTLTFTVANKPSWLSFNTSNGQISGTPTAADVGSFANIRITVSDGTANASLSAFSVAVTQIAVGSATVNWGAPTANADGTALTNLAGYKVLYGRSAANLDQSVTLNNPSLNTYLVTNLSAGTWYFAVVAVNAQGTESAPTNAASLTI